jgi:hypothetical protein
MQLTSFSAHAAVAARLLSVDTTVPTRRWWSAGSFPLHARGHDCTDIACRGLPPRSGCRTKSRGYRMAPRRCAIAHAPPLGTTSFATRFPTAASANAQSTAVWAVPEAPFPGALRAHHSKQTHVGLSRLARRNDGSGVTSAAASRNFATAKEVPIGRAHPRLHPGGRCCHSVAAFDGATGPVGYRSGWEITRQLLAGVWARRAGAG